MNFTKAELGAVLKASSKDATRHGLNSVRVESRRLIATDGHRLHMVEAGDDDAFRISHIDKPFSIDRVDADRLYKAMGKESLACPRRDPDPADPISSFGLATVRTIDIDGSAHRIAQMDADYPNYEQVLPKDAPKAVALLNAKLLKQACEAVIAAGADSKNHPMRLELGEDLCVARIVSGDLVIALMPMRDPIKKD